MGEEDDKVLHKAIAGMIIQTVLIYSYALNCTLKMANVLCTLPQ